MIVKSSLTLSVTTAGVPQRAVSSSTPCAQVFFQNPPGNTGNVVIKTPAGNVIAWLAPGSGDNAAGNSLPGESYDEGLAAPSTGNIFDLHDYLFDVEVNGESVQVTYGAHV